MPAGNKDELAAVRNWSNLKVAFNADDLWIKDLDYAQMSSIEIKSIPSKKIFYEKEGNLYLYNSLLPESPVPAVLWTAIERALPVKLPDYNHNFFGIDEQINASIISTESEHAPVAMIVAADILKDYLSTAPAVRLKSLRWAILNDNLCFVYGTPLLQLSAATFWSAGNHVLPAGYDFEFPMLAGILQKKIDLENETLIVWNTDSTYFLIGKNDLQPLSLGSYRSSMKNLTVL